MTKKKKIDKPIDLVYTADEIRQYIDEPYKPIVIKPIILQEPKVTDVARLRAQKALEANVKRGKK